jgi:uncharacterized protein
MRMASPPHLQGLPVWHEIITTDAEGARRFYTALFGWQEQPWPMGQAGVYLMFAVGERPICGVDDQSAAAGEPARWVTYFSVADVDAAVAANAAAGGRTLSGPTDVPEVGRIAACLDPQGALWCPFRGVRAPALPDPAHLEPGDFIWEELLSPGAEDAAEFYADCLGYSVELMDMGAMGLYRLLKVEGSAVAGVLPMPPGAPGPARWLPYVKVSDVDAVAARAVALGGKLHFPPTDIGGVGRIAVMDDPQGAMIALYKPDQPPAR